jgi:hypothetical protein
MGELYRPPQFHSQNREYFGVFGPVDFGQTVDGTVVSELEKSAFRDIECDSFGTASPGVRDRKGAAPPTASIVRPREAILGKAPERRAMRVGKTRRDSEERRSAREKTGLRIAPTAHLLPRDGEKPFYIPHLKIEMWATQLFVESQTWATRRLSATPTHRKERDERGTASLRSSWFFRGDDRATCRPGH